ncbi:hypothetical protein M5E88_01610 [Akkermansia muciniphila]|nr:hypothetical protein M5E88_01610 [Akkermansia muciniphila]
MPEIHPTAVVHPAAEIADDVKIGPFCVVGEHVKLGPGCVLHSHVVIDGPSSFGSGNEFFPFSVIGLKSQDLKYKGSRLIWKWGITMSSVKTPPSTGLRILAARRG